jgi:hypothetical protein
MIVLGSTTQRRWYSAHFLSSGMIIEAWRETPCLPKGEAPWDQVSLSFARVLAA